MVWRCDILPVMGRDRGSADGSLIPLESLMHRISKCGTLGARLASGRIGGATIPTLRPSSMLWTAATRSGSGEFLFLGW